MQLAPLVLAFLCLFVSGITGDNPGCNPRYGFECNISCAAPRVQHFVMVDFAFNFDRTMDCTGAIYGEGDAHVDEIPGERYTGEFTTPHLWGGPITCTKREDSSCPSGHRYRVGIRWGCETSLEDGKLYYLALSPERLKSALDMLDGYVKEGGFDNASGVKIDIFN